MIQAPAIVLMQNIINSVTSHMRFCNLSTNNNEWNCFLLFQAQMVVVVVVGPQSMDASVMVVAVTTVPKAITRQTGPTTIQLELHWCVVPVVNQFAIGIC